MPKKTKITQYLTPEGAAFTSLDQCKASEHMTIIAVFCGGRGADLTLIEGVNALVANARASIKILGFKLPRRSRGPRKSLPAGLASAYGGSGQASNNLASHPS